jgi:hypothetical protein
VRISSLSVYLYACWVAMWTLVGIAWLGVFNLRALFVRVVVVAVSYYFICARTCSKADIKGFSTTSGGRDAAG